MSTRGAIAYATGDGFRGVYHRWDSYPSGLGATLWERAHKTEDLGIMLHDLIENHPAGFSTIIREQECYCHSLGKEEPWEVTEKNAAGSGVEYVYAFDVVSRTMSILSSYTTYEGCEVKMIGMFGMGDPDATWRAITILDLDGPEPDWEALGEA